MKSSYYLAVAMLGGLVVIGAGCPTTQPLPNSTNGTDDSKQVQVLPPDTSGDASDARPIVSDDRREGDNENEREDWDDDDAQGTVQPTATTPAPSTKATSSAQTQPVSTGATVYTMAQVAAANNASKCFTAVSGKVYDLTPELNRHPGGQKAILSLCGKDGTAAFTAQHGGQRRPMSELNGLEIGILK